MSKLSQQTTAVYLCFIPDYGNLYFGDKRTKQTEYSRRLLRYAYKKQFGVDLATQNLRVSKTGKLECDKHHLSVSHSGNYVCVAVSTAPVGVDLQKFNGEKVMNVAKKFFTEEEQTRLAASENKLDTFYFTWCKKEALWKSLETQPMTIATVNSTKSDFFVQKLQLDGENYYLAVTGEAASVTFVDATELPQ